MPTSQTVRCGALVGAIAAVGVWSLPVATAEPRSPLPVAADGPPPVGSTARTAVRSTARVAGHSALVVPFARPVGLRRPRAAEDVPAFWADAGRCSVGCRPSAASGWPLRPFHVQHPLRAGLNELRSGSMHIGVDIQSREGERVYALQSGRALVLRRPDGDIFVRIGAFEYWHLLPLVKTGEHVEAYRTVLGTVRSQYRHVHLSERARGRYVNPLRPGGRVLAPWGDRAAPVIDVPEVQGSQVTVRAFDPQTFVRLTPYETPVLAPAALAYRLYSLDRRPVTALRFALRGSQHYAFSFAPRIFTPDARSPGFTCFASQRHCVPNWRYRLAGGLAPQLPVAPPGSYLLTVYAWDWAGNTSALDLRIHRTATAWLASAHGISDAALHRT